MADAYDFSYLPRHDLAAVLRIQFPHVVLTESMTLLNQLIQNSKLSTEKWLMIDIGAPCLTFDRIGNRDAVWIHSGHNMGNSLTKPVVCMRLELFLQT